MPKRRLDLKMSSLLQHEETVRQMFLNGYSDTQISNFLITEMGLRRGASERSMRQFRMDRGLTREVISDQHLEMAVAEAIHETGPGYGRKMVTGYLSAKGIHASERRVGRMLAKVQDPYHRDRQQGIRNLNPQPYQAEYMGHKLHMDQNEKLAMYGVTHVVSIDGFSSKIVAHATMPIKNNLFIYEKVYSQTVAGEIAEKMEELVLAAEELPAISQTLRELSEYAAANKRSTVALTTAQASSVQDTFKSVICRDVMNVPVVAPCCRSLIGCNTCISEWVMTSPNCPK